MVRTGDTTGEDLAAIERHGGELVRHKGNRWTYAGCPLRGNGKPEWLIPHVNLVRLAEQGFLLLDAQLGPGTKPTKAMITELGRLRMASNQAQGPYAGFLGTLIERFDDRIKRIKVVNNFDHGDEFEVAICGVLREVMPARVGVCRGYVVGQDGSLAGDDIVLFDRSRFPTLRLLGNDLSLKEHIPAEAVLAYIEAKHTLYLYPNAKQQGQSLEKALAQVRAVKNIKRTTVSMQQLGDVVLSTRFGNVTGEVGLPAIRNPYACAIWAPNIDPGRGRELESDCVIHRIFEILGNVTEPTLPDVIAAGRCLTSPIVQIGSGWQPVPMLSAGCELAGSLHASRVLGLALFHLLWSIELIQLGTMPWSPMLNFELGKAGVVRGRLVTESATPHSESGGAQTVTEKRLGTVITTKSGRCRA
jgi:hypothetical protein